MTIGLKKNTGKAELVTELLAKAKKWREELVTR